MIVDNAQRVAHSVNSCIKPDIQRMRSLIRTIVREPSCNRYLVTCANESALDNVRGLASHAIGMVDDACNRGRMFDVGSISAEDIDGHCRDRVVTTPDEYHHPYLAYVVTYIQDNMRFFTLVTASTENYSKLLPFDICSFCYGPTRHVRFVIHGRCAEDGLHFNDRGFKEGQQEWRYTQELLQDDMVILCMLFEMLRYNCPSKSVNLSTIDKQSLRARGEPLPIGPYRLQDIAHYSTILRPRITAQYEAKGGTHASPVPHDRRGHMRRYKSGKESWVNATRVNGGKDILGPGRSHYKVDMELI